MEETKENVIGVTSAIRKLTNLDCSEVAIILAVLAAQMQKVGGFGGVDIAAIDEAIGCIDGKNLADVNLSGYFGDVMRQVNALTIRSPA